MRAVVLADDAVFGHEVDQPGGAAVADAQRPLQQRDAAAAFADHDVDGRFVQLVAVGQLAGAFAAGRIGGLELHQLVDELRLGRADEVDDAR